MSLPLFILNGPNLDRLGQREPEIYGGDTLADIRQACENRAQQHGLTIDFRQTNHEGALVEHVHAAIGRAAVVIINPAAYGHTSIALHDALKMLDAPIIEVHLSHPGAREAFRAASFVTSLARGVISGFGAMSYLLAVDAACELAAGPSD